MKKNIFFLFLSIASYAQTTISYSELKKMVDGTQREAVSIIKAKGFSYNNKSDSEYVIYDKDNSSIFMNKKVDGSVSINIYKKKYEYISTNILNSIIKIGYHEYNSENTDTLGFCTSYLSTNYYIMFCDDIQEYNDGSKEAVFTVYMNKRD